jgi:hypothetical protein
MDVVNLEEKLSRFTERWSPQIVGEVNDMHVKLVKLAGEFVWHRHEREDEPTGTVNTGDVANERTVSALDRL